MNDLEYQCWACRNVTTNMTCEHCGAKHGYNEGLVIRYETVVKLHERLARLEAAARVVVDGAERSHKDGKKGMYYMSYFVAKRIDQLRAVLSGSEAGVSDPFPMPPPDPTSTTGA